MKTYEFLTSLPTKYVFFNASELGGIIVSGKVLRSLFTETIIIPILESNGLDFVSVITK